MRKIALVVVLLAVTLCLLASGTERETVKVYFSVEIDGGPSCQIWRCNVDASEPELLHEDDHIGELAIDSEEEKLFFVASRRVYMADLDGSNVDGGHFFVDDMESSVQNHVDAKSGYLCFADFSHVLTIDRPAWEEAQYIHPSDIPGMPDVFHVKGVALHVTDESPVQSTTWGRIKSAFR